MKEESRGHTNRVNKQQRNEVLKPRRPLLRRRKNNWLQVHRHAKTVERPTVGVQLSIADRHSQVRKKLHSVQKQIRGITA